MPTHLCAVASSRSLLAVDLLPDELCLVVALHEVEPDAACAAWAGGVAAVLGPAVAFFGICPLHREMVGKRPCRHSLPPATRVAALRVSGAECLVLDSRGRLFALSADGPADPMMNDVVCFDVSPAGLVAWTFSGEILLRSPQGIRTLATLDRPYSISCNASLALCLNTLGTAHVVALTDKPVDPYRALLSGPDFDSADKFPIAVNPFGDSEKQTTIVSAVVGAMHASFVDITGKVLITGVVDPREEAAEPPRDALMAASGRLEALIVTENNTLNLLAAKKDVELPWKDAKVARIGGHASSPFFYALIRTTETHFS